VWYCRVSTLDKPLPNPPLQGEGTLIDLERVGDARIIYPVENGQLKGFLWDWIRIYFDDERAWQCHAPTVIQEMVDGVGTRYYRALKRWGFNV